MTTLFPGDGQATYAVLDGAACPDLLAQFDALAPEYVCLYAGPQEPDMLEVAPYLVALPPDHAFTAWLLAQGLGKHWGVFAHTPADMLAMRKHCRTFLKIRDPEGKLVYFRWYDPRVLRTYLPTCNEEEAETVFGPVSHYVIEDAKPDALLKFSRFGKEVGSLRVSIAA